MLNDHELLVYNGPKKPELPYMPMGTVSAEFQELQAMSQRRSDENNLTFLYDVLIHEECPEFNCYNTRLCRDQGHTIASKTKIVYLPLIDMPPEHPSTMFTSMMKAQHICQKIGQEYVLFTCDQQFYRVALQVKWDNPDVLNNVYLRLGSMHLIMSYVGSVGTLMVEIGLDDILSAAFGGVTKMLSGKKYPQNVRTLRLLTEELLRPVFQKHDEIHSMADLFHILDDLATQSRSQTSAHHDVLHPY